MTQSEIWFRLLDSKKAFIEYDAALIELLRAIAEGNNALVERWHEECDRLGRIVSECQAAAEEIRSERPILPEYARTAFEDWWRTVRVMNNVRDVCLNGLGQLSPALRHLVSLAGAKVDWPANIDRPTLETSLVVFFSLRDRAISRLSALPMPVAL